MTPLLLLLTAAWADDAPEFAPHKKMMKNIVETTGCAQEDMQATFVDSYTKNKVVVQSWNIEGCPKSPFIITFWRKGGNWQWWSDVDLRKKAPFDLDCDAASLEYTFIDAKTRGVEGCDRRATYVLTGAGWIANVTSE